MKGEIVHRQMTSPMVPYSFGAKITTLKTRQVVHSINHTKKVGWLFYEDPGVVLLLFLGLVHFFALCIIRRLTLGGNGG